MTDRIVLTGAGRRGPQGIEGPQGIPGEVAPEAIAARDQSREARDAAELARDQAVDISNIAIDDDIVEILVKPGATGAKTKAALAGSYVAFVNYGTNTSTARPSAVGLVVWRGDEGAGLPIAAQPQDIVVIPNDATAPTVPSSVVASMSGSNVVLTWAASTDTNGVTGYKVYRGTTPGFVANEASLLATVTSGLTYTDTSPVSGPSYYKVSAYDPNGNESAASSRVSPFNPFGIGVTWHTVAWAQAESLSDASVLASIVDQSGNARNFTTAGSPVFTTASTGLNSKKAYRFDGVDDVATTATAFAAVAVPYTMVIVGKRTRLGSGARAAVGGVTVTPTSSAAIQWSTTNYIYTLNAGVDLNPNRTDDLFVMTAEANGSTSTFNINGYSATGDAGGSNSPVKWIVGNKQGTTWFSQIDVAFVGFVAGTLTSGQREALREGAASYYGVTVI